MKKIYKPVFLLVSLFLLAISAIHVYAQNDEDTPLDDDFVEALVLMSVNHNLMEGKDEVRDLGALHDFVTNYYDDRMASTQDSDQITALGIQKQALMAKLEKKIQVRSGVALMNTFLTLFTDAEEVDMLTSQNKAQVRNLVSDNADQGPDYFTVMNSIIMTDFETQVNLLLDIDTITINPSLAPIVLSNSSWSYDTPAISDSAPAIATQNDQQPAANASPDPSGNDGEEILKPVRFTNNGFEPVTVVIETYEPAAGENHARSSASVVVDPDSNSSAYMDLPIGTYTFCYYWQLDEDYNDDDYFDYHHRITKAITINQNSSDNPESATVVTLNPDSAVSNPNGRCGENIEQPSGLSAEEKANAGTHNYLATCNGADWCEGEVLFSTLTFTFSSGSLNVNEHDGKESTFTRIGQNTYSWTNVDGDVWVITFRTNGFTYAVNSEVAVFLYELQD